MQTKLILFFYNSRIYGEDLASKKIKSPCGFGCFCPKVVVLLFYSLLVVAPIVCGGLVLGLCCFLQYFVSFLVLQSSHCGRAG